MKFYIYRHRYLLIIFCSAVLMLGSCKKQQISKEITPLISKKGKLLFEDDFEGTEARSEWRRPLHGTQWEISKGVFKGIPSTKEFQASRAHHTGKTPSMLLKVGARDCIIQISVKISRGLDAAHIGFNEGPTQTTSGHIFRLILDVNKGVFLRKDRNSQVSDDKDEILDQSDWKPMRNHWIAVLIETQKEKVVAQIVDGPTLEMQSSRFNVSKASANLKARGEEGAIEYDNVKIWEALPID